MGSLILRVCTGLFCMGLVGALPLRAVGQQPEPTALELHPFPASLTLDSLDQIPPPDTAIVKSSTSLPVLVMLPPTVKADQSTSLSGASTILRLLFRHQLSIAKPGKMQFNISARPAALWPYPTDFGGEKVLPKSPQLIRDFKNANCDFLVLTEMQGTVDEGKFTLALHNLRTGKSDSREYGWTNADIFPAVRKAVTDIAQFAEWSEKEIEESGLTVGSMTPEAWKSFCLASGSSAYETIGRHAIDMDPSAFQTAYAISYAVDWNLARINSTIDKAPWDHRLVLAKIEALGGRFARPVSAMHLIRALDRIMPNNYLIKSDGISYLSDAFKDPKCVSVTPTSAMERIGNDATEFAVARGKDWMAEIIAARTWSTLASVVRGGQTYDKVKPESAEKHQRWNVKSMDHLILTRETLGDDYASLHGLMANVYQTARMGPTPDELVQLAHKAEPNNPATALTVAYYTSIGWGDQKEYEKTIRQLLERHKNDRAAQYKIFESVAENFRRIPLFTKQNPKEVYLDPAGLGSLIVQTLRSDYLPKPYAFSEFRAEQLHALALAHGDTELAEAILDASFSVNLLWETYKPFLQNNSTDWPKIEKLCAKLVERMTLQRYKGDTRPVFLEQLETARYGLIRSRWKQGKWQAALKDADKGMTEAPGNYLNFYMYAVIADGKAIEPEKVYQCALKAVRLQPTHDASRKLYASVCKKNGRPSEIPDIQVPE